MQAFFQYIKKALSQKGVDTAVRMKHDSMVCSADIVWRDLQGLKSTM